MSVADRPATAAETDLGEAKTSAGCGFQFFAGMLKLLPGTQKQAWGWDGACAGGLAEGTGTLTHRTVFDYGTSIATHRLAFHAGRPFGYMITSVRSEPQPTDVAPLAMPTSWEFIANGQLVGASEGSGLTLDASGLGKLPMPTPRQGPALARRFVRISGLGKILMVEASNCFTERTALKGCESDLREVYLVSEMDRGSDATTNYLGRKKTYCSDPFDLTSCSALVERIGAPMRAEVLTVIESGRPSVEETTARMAAALQSARAVAPAVPMRPAAGTPDLDALSVGGLYALADEAADRNDLAQARAALRALVRRFPDHPLAAAAARRLAAMQSQ